MNTRPFMTADEAASELAKLTSIIVIEPSGSVGLLTRMKFTLEDFQTLVGGNIEAVGSGPRSMFVNEDGKGLGLRVNVPVTMWCDYHHFITHGDTVHGTVVVIGEPDDEGETVGISPRDITQILTELCLITGTAMEIMFLGEAQPLEGMEP